MRSSIQKPTIWDIAQELNITASTVSRALSGHSSISVATKKAVLHTAKKLNYHPNQIASALRSGTSKIIGVIIPSAEINFFGSVVHGIEKIASARGYNVLLFQSNELVDYEKKGIATFLRSRVDGVFASIAKETTNVDHYRELKKKGIPLVLFDRTRDDLDVPSVVIDDYKGAFMATQHLIDQGCRCIAHIAGPQHIPIFVQRLSGYKDALIKNGLLFQSHLVSYGSVSIESGEACMEQLMHQSKNIDGVFAVEDFSALGAMQSLKAAGKKIPEDVCLAGFANEAFCSYLTPSLTTVDQQTTRIGEEAAQLFFNLAKNRNFYKEPWGKIVLKPELVIRESSRRMISK